VEISRRESFVEVPGIITQETAGQQFAITVAVMELVLAFAL
jgi:hypothetical protein